MEQADRWLVEIDRAMQSLKEMPERFGFATEKGLRDMKVRQMGVGVGSRPTHRVLYGVIGDEVVIYRVRSARQDKMGPSDLKDA